MTFHSTNGLLCPHYPAHYEAPEAHHEWVRCAGCREWFDLEDKRVWRGGEEDAAGQWHCENCKGKE